MGDSTDSATSAFKIIATLSCRDGDYLLHQSDALLAAEGGCQITMEYFAEGAANVLFSIKLLGSTPSSNLQCDHLHEFVRGKLLRLRKGNQASNQNASHQSVAPPPVVNAAEINSFIKDHIATSIPEKYIAEHTLVRLDEEFLERCNALLQALEKENKRSRKRCGWYINTKDPQGFLVEDMSPRGDHEITIEFKPKWLSQSPIADSSSRRCRTCAWHTKNDVVSNKRYCPLALASGNRSWVEKQIQKFRSHAHGDIERITLDRAIDLIVTYFCEGQPGHEMIRDLQVLQRVWGTAITIRNVGITEANFRSGSMEERLSLAEKALEDPTNEGFEQLSWAMTVRDCVIFIRISTECSADASNIEAKIADLDLKRVEPEKLLKWAADEMLLLHDGFYSGLEVMDPLELSKPDLTCLLWHPQGRGLYKI